MTVIYVKTIVAVILGFSSGLAVVYIFNRMPAKWLCDYDQEPSKELEDPGIQRIKGWPWRWLYAGLFACIALRLVFTEIHRPPRGLEGLPDAIVQIISQSQLMLAALLACFAMAVIAIADHKYMIIPDQFVIVLAIASLGFLPLHSQAPQLLGSLTALGGALQPLGGLALGGGVMLLTAIIGKATTKRDVMGMGDVKLCAAMGLSIGISGMIFVLVAGCLASGIDAAIGLARKKYGRYDVKPLGPWLCAAGIIYIFIIWPFYL